jgi:hypothetical protein
MPNRLAPCATVAPHRSAMRFIATAAAAAVLATATSAPLVAQAIQGPTYRTAQSFSLVTITLTSWMASAGVDPTGTARYYHWFTGTASMPNWNAGGGYYVMAADETIYLAPLAVPPGSPNPYVGCATCGFTFAFSGGAGSTTTISSAATIGTFATTYADFLVPGGQNGVFRYEYYAGGAMRDRDVFDERAEFVQIAPAPTVTTPEPSTWALVGGGLVLVAFAGRRRRGID